MRSIFAASILSIALAAPAFAQTTAPAAPAPAAPTAGQVAKDAANTVRDGAAAAGAAVSHAAAAVSAKLEDLKDGWRLRNDVIGQSVYDEKNARIGEIDDLILTRDASKAYRLYAIVGVGGFLGIGERKVATPLDGLSKVDGKFVMHGATKDGLTNWPEYKYVPAAGGATTAPAPAPAAPAPAPAPKQ